MKDVPTFKDTSFDALIGCDVMDQIPNLTFHLAKRCVSWGETKTDSQRCKTAANFCAEINPNITDQFWSEPNLIQNSNPFMNLSKCGNEVIEPYAFPMIAEYDTTPERQGSFSVWQDGVVPYPPADIDYEETTSESKVNESIREAEKQSNPISNLNIENFVELIAQAVVAKSKIANTQEQLPISKLETENQNQKLLDKMYQETEEFYRQFSDNEEKSDNSQTDEIDERFH